MDITWILVAAVSLSLILSIVSLILQILRGRSSNKTPKTKAEAKPQNVSPPSYSPQGAMANPYPAPAPQPWRPPAAPVQQSSHTEPLFSAAPQSFAMAGGRTEQVRNNIGYNIQIQESSPNGQRSYELRVTGEFPIGRSHSSGLQIDDSTVSGLQCVLIAGPDTVFVSNRSNSNVTRLNGAKVEDTRPLKQGDTLSLGNIQLALLDIRKL